MHYAEILDVKPAHITVRDTSSRWGSCSSTRNLSFSWRLILAPSFVLEYVVAHEVAHLREMNHGRRFWRLVEDLVGNVERPQAVARRKRRDAPPLCAEDGDGIGLASGVLCRA